MRPEDLRNEPRAAVPVARAEAALARLQDAITREFAGRIALVSSFGAEAVVLLHMVSLVDRATPVLFVDTGALFPETLSYQRAVAGLLGLSDIRHLRPDPAALAVADPDGQLHRRDPDACCALRKVAPLDAALAGFDAWITGRKRFQAATRAALPFRERDEAGRVKLNPLADWSAAELGAWRIAHGLPAHPLVERGYPSIGCAPCTSPVAEGEHPRAGRWRGRDKEECGIHIVGGRVIRVPLRGEEPCPS
ncbi:MAG: phosphoadenylyl-sulfate reductase [Alphaproteobacteria bacterium]|nr:MAG: phosphoadenylyl-sulfate reductase [Alphaproteobacteria bacterium]